MKIVGKEVDFMMVAPEVLPEDARRWHPVSEIVGTVYMVTEKVGHVVVSGYEAGTHDGMRDGANGGFEKFNSIVRIYFDEAGLKEAGYKLPQAPLPAQEKKTCKTHGCPSGFHICTKYA
jgi:hypothetical protein